MEKPHRDAGEAVAEIVRKLVREIEQPQSSYCPVCSLTITKKPTQRAQELIRATKTALLLFECQRNPVPASPSAVAMIEQSEARDPDLVGESDSQPWLTVLARQCRVVIESCEAAGVEIDDGNVIDLCADNLPDVPLPDLRNALVVAGLASRFPKATGAHP